MKKVLVLLIFGVLCSCKKGPKDLVNRSSSDDLTNDKDSLYQEIIYYPDKTKNSEGKKLNGKRIEEWNEYHRNGNISHQLQYFIVDNESYLNQVTLFDEKGDTIYGQGNYYKTKLEKNDFFYSLSFWLAEPHLSRESDIYFVVPTDKSLRFDLRNFAEILNVPKDTIRSVIHNPDIIQDKQIDPLSQPYRQMVVYNFKTKRDELVIQGYLDEVLTENDSSGQTLETLRRIFVNEKIDLTD